MSTVLQRLQERFLGSASKEAVALEAERQKLEQAHAELEEQRALLEQQIASAQSEADRALIAEARQVNAEAADAAEREKARLSLAHEKNRAKLRAEIQERLHGLLDQQKARRAKIEEAGRDLGALEKRGRDLWRQITTSVKQGEETDRQIHTMLEELRALGAAASDLPEAPEVPAVLHAYVSAAELVRAFDDVRGEFTFARPLLARFFEKAALYGSKQS